MSKAERLAAWDPARLIEYVAACAEQLGHAAGVGGRETAGALISYLADHPEHLEPFLNGGISELHLEWITGGRLTWHAGDGRVVHPSEVRSARQQQPGDAR